MAKIAYKDPKNLRSETKKLLKQILQVVEEYDAQGFKLTLRQLYYQLVANIIIPNVDGQYGKLSGILKDARMCGKVDWDIIEDRDRIPIMPSQWNDIQDLVDSAIYSYRKDRMKGQEYYVEVWVEKNAISNVLKPITEEYHINLLANRGYSSVTAMHDAALRFEQAIDDNKYCTVLYLGDHDPSGLDMIRDIQNRLNEFNVEVNVKAIALTKQQIQKYNPPPNPVKFSDPRATGYEELHGKKSWELDALKPNVLHRLLRKEIENYIDMDIYNKIVKQEQREKKKLIKLAEDI